MPKQFLSCFLLSRLVCLALLFCSSLGAATEEPGHIELFNRDSYSATHHLFIFHDVSGEMSIRDVVAADEAGEFRLNSDDTLNFGFLDHPVWIRFDATYPDNYPNTEPFKEWYLEVAAPLLDKGVLFQVFADGSITERRSDISMGFNERDLNHVYSVFPVTLALGETRRFYIKMQTSGSFYFPIKLWEPEAYAVKVADEEFLYGMFYGSMLCIIIFNLLIYFSVRDVGYLYYIAYLAGITLLFFIDLGHGVNLFDNGGDIFHKDTLNTIIWFNWIAVSLFLRSFLETKKNYPLIDAFLIRISVVAFLYMILDFYMPYQVSISWGALVTLALFLGFAPICLYAWRNGNINAIYFLAAWAFNMLGLSIYSLISLGFLPSSTLLVALAPLGILSEAVLLSFALAERVKRAQRNMVEADQRALDHLSRYQSVFNNALEGIYQLSLDGRFMRVNPSMAKNLGFQSPQDLMFAGPSAVNYCYTQPESQYQRLLKHKNLKEEISYHKKDGSLAWADHSAQLICDEEGLPSHIEGTFIDITERKRREEAEKQREQEKAEEEIATKMAAAKTEFLANMSHQIRTPLTSIIGHSEAIKSLNLSGSEREDAIKTIAHSSEHLLSLINDILDYSKIEAGKLQLEEIPVQLEEFLHQLQHRFGWQAEQKGLRFSIDYTTDVPATILSDAARLQHILDCLVSNGIKYTKQGYVKVSVAWLAETAQMQIQVADSGVGMSGKEVTRLFDVFSLHDESQVRHYGGSRLSMAIAKELALLLGGDLTVESAEGAGTEFCLCFKPGLPANVTWLAPRQGLYQPAGKDRDQRKIQPPTLLGEVLLAEDNKVNQALISKIIAKTGARVTLVENGLLALEHARDKAFDLILMDINMPEMDGLEATRCLLAEGISTPVFALTAETDEKELARARSSGCVGCLAKPVDRVALYQVLESYLEKLA